MKTELHRRVVAVVEIAVCVPLIMLLLLGLWEVWRIAQFSNVLWNCTRQAAPGASLSQGTPQTLASNLLTYLQGALPNSFNPSHSTFFISPTITLSANTTAYRCRDNTTNQKLCTIPFTATSNPSATDPAAMQKMDVYLISCSFREDLLTSGYLNSTGECRKFGAVGDQQRFVLSSKAVPSARTLNHH